MNQMSQPLTPSAASSVCVKKVGPHLGAEISGVNLAAGLTDADVEVINAAFVEHEVLVFRNQKISVDEYMAFARRFGELSVHPFSTSLPERPELIVLDNDQDAPPLSTDQWHSDEMFRERPAMATVLRSTIIPEVGGNTVFASMTTAYDSLNPALQECLCALEALHDFKVFRVLYSGTSEGRKRLLDLEEAFPNQRHPIVRVHPVSGKRAIFVSPQTTKQIVGVRDFESEHLLQMLYQLPQIPEYQFRVVWEPDMIVMWDNRSTQHYAPRDYLPARRRMERLTLKGDKPFGVAVERATVAAASRPIPQPERKVGQYKSGLARPAETILERAK
jgi:taurine dioxygenase